MGRPETGRSWTHLQDGQVGVGILKSCNFAERVDFRDALANLISA